MSKHLLAEGHNHPLRHRHGGAFDLRPNMMLDPKTWGGAALALVLCHSQKRVVKALGYGEGMAFGQKT